MTKSNFSYILWLKRESKDHLNSNTIILNFEKKIVINEKDNIKKEKNNMKKTKLSQNVFKKSFWVEVEVGNPI